MEINPNLDAVPVDAVLVAEIELSPEEMQALQEEAERQDQLREQSLSNLAREIEDRWTKASSDRNQKEEQWRKAINLFLGNLAAERGARNKNPNNQGNEGGKVRPDHNLVKIKCTTAIAQLWSQQFAGGDKNWDILPSPKPDVDPGVAASAAELLEKEIEDQLTATKYGDRCRDAIKDRVIYGTGILKGPVPAIQKKRMYDMVNGPNGPVAIPRFEAVPRPEVYRVDPWMFYPDQSVNDIRDAEFAIEVHPMNKTQLRKLAMSEGFMDDVILSLLKQGPQEYNEEYFNDVTALTDSGENYLKNKYAVLEYHGPISIDQAKMLGLEPSYESLDETYIGEVWVCMGRVIRASLEVIDGAYQLPYMASVWLKDPNSPFGFGLPLEMEDAQRIHTATLHMLLDNAAVSGGPQIVINREYIKPVNNVWEIQPHKLWESTDSTLLNIDQAFKSYVIPNVSSELSPLLGMAQQWAMEESGINAIAAGMAAPQAGADSATGLAIMQQQATIVTDMLNVDWDDNITQILIDRMYHWNIQYNLRPEFQGFDFEVDVRSSTELRNKQMQVNNLEKLSIEAGQNPLMADWINTDKLTEARLAMMRLPDVGIVRTPEEYAQVQEQKAQQPQPPDPNMVKLEIERGRLEMEAKRLELETQKLQLEATIRDQQFQLEMQTRQEQNQARREDAQARIIQANLEKESKMLELAMRDETARAKILADLEKFNMQAETDKFLEGMRINDRAQDRLMAAQEMKLKVATGSGI